MPGISLPSATMQTINSAKLFFSHIQAKKPLGKFVHAPLWQYQCLIQYK